MLPALDAVCVGDARLHTLQLQIQVQGPKAAAHIRTTSTLRWTAYDTSISQLEGARPQSAAETHTWRLCVLKVLLKLTHGHQT